MSSQPSNSYFGQLAEHRRQMSGQGAESTMIVMHDTPAIEPSENLGLASLEKCSRGSRISTKLGIDITEDLNGIQYAFTMTVRDQKAPSLFVIHWEDRKGWWVAVLSVPKCSKSTTNHKKSISILKLRSEMGPERVTKESKKILREYLEGRIQGCAKFDEDIKEHLKREVGNSPDEARIIRDLETFFRKGCVSVERRSLAIIVAIINLYCQFFMVPLTTTLVVRAQLKDADQLAELLKEKHEVGRVHRSLKESTSNPELCFKDYHEEEHPQEAKRHVWGHNGCLESHKEGSIYATDVYNFLSTKDVLVCSAFGETIEEQEEDISLEVCHKESLNEHFIATAMNPGGFISELDKGACECLKVGRFGGTNYPACEATSSISEKMRCPELSRILIECQAHPRILESPRGFRHDQDNQHGSCKDCNQFIIEAAGLLTNDVREINAPKLSSSLSQYECKPLENQEDCAGKPESIGYSRKKRRLEASTESGSSPSKYLCTSHSQTECKSNFQLDLELSQRNAIRLSKRRHPNRCRKRSLRLFVGTEFVEHEPDACNDSISDLQLSNCPHHWPTLQPDCSSSPSMSRLSPSPVEMTQRASCQDFQTKGKALKMLRAHEAYFLDLSEKRHARLKRIIHSIKRQLMMQLRSLEH
mmetsp:Transcript_32687/g.56854  ORF Transcript_32687/g.56854 Transcript_32687/m.56854 type:complete len:645 (+) Transcript_32687:373-2307(+)